MSSINSTTSFARNAGLKRPNTFLSLTPVCSPKPVVPTSRFLSLVPVTSASYPRAPAVESNSVSNIPDSLLWIAPSPVVRATGFRQRADSSSSISSIESLGSVSSEDLRSFSVYRTGSVSSTNDKQRFLKLGPVHWGGTIGDDDFALQD
jgi:hypothetical protein